MRDQDFKTDEGEFIRLNGVRQNNIKNIDVQFPLGKMTVVTGLSGSGKSSLVFETLHAEGQRRYVETFSAYTRQFLDLLDKPEVDVVVNIRPSIAIQQSNTVKTSRSTVGTMTELCDYFKVWFNHQCECFDPETGELVVDEHPEWIFDQLPEIGSEAYLVVAFRIQKPEKLKWNELISPIVSQGYQRTLLEGRFQKLEDVDWGKYEGNEIIVIQDRIKGPHENASRCIDALTTAQHFGSGEVDLYDVEGSLLGRYSRGLHSTKSGKTFRDKSSALFSFNSPLGACPKCRGFGRVIEIDYNLVIPDRSISIKDGAIRAFSGEVYQESLNDLLRACRKKKIKTSVPWQDMSESDLEFVMNGEPGYQPGDFDKNGSWYGVKRFFQFLESTTYKMHVRVFLSKYRSYVTCPDCGGTRLQPESLNWKWEGYRLPDLYRMPIRDLYQLVSEKSEHVGNTQVDIARESILNRLKYLNDVGLGYLNLDRSSRTLSGGEVERVNLTACLGTQLTDTLFVLDEPSVGLHSRDIDRLIRILRLLTSLGNTVVLVEHDERVIQAADHLIEMGPRAGSGGGELVFEGTLHEMKQSRPSLTGAYLSGRKAINIPQKRRVVDLESFPLGDENLGTAEKKQGFLTIRGASKHNIKNLNLTLPLNRFVCLTGVSGSGKSTLLNNVIYQGLMQTAGRSVENPARIEELLCDFDQPPILVDQSAVSRTPRSNPALFADAWELIRKLYASTEGAKSLGFTHSEFSFNGGNGRCEHCQGLGYEKVEMQFLSDVYVKCPVCEGRRFKKSVLGIEWNEKSIADVLEMDIWTAVEFFSEKPKIKERLNPLVEVGLGYLKMGQPLNTLSGGESQRLKLVKYLSQLNAKEGSSMLLLDEPTTGLHKEDVNVLIDVLQKIVDHGHSLFVIEHHIDVIQAADWVVEMGPDSGNAGGELVAAGKPEWIAQTSSETAKYLFEDSKAEKTLALVAEEKAAYRSGNGSSESERFQGISLRGAREHNLKNLDVQIPNQTITVVTGVSGSGKSSLAFDIIFAEGQRRFMESMSAYARQFVEQLPRPDIDELKGISPTVAIEQRVTRGSRKSTVATITEVAQYLRLLYARMGVQHSPVTGDPVIALPFSEVESRATRDLEEWISNAPVSGKLYLCASVIRGRKGHHQPIANWAIGQGFEWLRCDGKLVKLSEFEKLNRYEEHDIDVVLDVLKKKSTNDELNEFAGRFLRANQIGKGSFFYLDHLGKVVGRYSTSRVDPVSGVVYPELDPKHFSWNSPKGWCPSCRGHGRVVHSLYDEEPAPLSWNGFKEGAECPDCEGARLNTISRSVKLKLKDGSLVSLPQLLSLTSEGLLEKLADVVLDARGKAIMTDILPQIRERLHFMGEVGLEYLSLDRDTATLSGGEAQRIRLASQLGTNLTGVHYVLDEPSIGLHPRDGQRLIHSLQKLRDKGNTLVVVEHDEEIMRSADRLIDMGPGAGIHGGELVANGRPDEVMSQEKSVTGSFLKDGIDHPLLGKFRKLPKKPVAKGKLTNEWIGVRKTALRNLKGDDLLLPLNKLIMVCGVSGAGKSTLVRDLLKPALEKAIETNASRLNWKDAKSHEGFSEVGHLSNKDAPFLDLQNGNQIHKVIEMDQSPIGKTPRSNPATYIGIFDTIRQIFAASPEAKMKGFDAGSFSFNTPKGRCESCKGAGRIKLEMGFMPDTYVECDSCNGSRYNREVEDVLWKGKSIVDVLNMSFEDALEFFDFHSGLKEVIRLVVDTGLGYLTLGQSSPSLSGGEAQRIKLVSELSKGVQSYKDRSRGVVRRNFYILEEPTIGLHQKDTKLLILLLQKLVDQGHTVLVIEHHLDMLAEADYIVEVGPESGERGGQICYQGEIKKFLKEDEGPTSSFLRNLHSFKG